MGNQMTIDKHCYCASENGFGQQWSSGVALKVLYGPAESKIHPDSLVVKNGFDTTPLQCSADCNPPCNISWFKDDRNIADKPMLNLGVANKDTAGIYKCYAGNDYGNSSREVNVTVKYITVKVSPKKVSCTQGESINAQCSASGIPPNVNFLRWEHRIGSTVIRTLSKIEIERCTYQDVGTYVCQVSNSIGMYKEENVSVEIKGVVAVIVIIVVLGIVAASVAIWFRIRRRQANKRCSVATQQNTRISFDYAAPRDFSEESEEDMEAK
ncbi:hypothetical protein KUTeg_001770 [Tegillarca granosa]|uniref:Ig-like domain-containing protein n=1 Tax=Tegillarca granosa TaxID=220873 RepID=A0ABQ9FSF0_TEGGR|nr:hypothetical protein KUTeg_001770 [Tegillarca granosa]